MVPGGGTCCLDRAHARAGQHGKGDDRDLPQVDFIEAAPSAACVADRLAGAKADGEAVKRAGPHQRQELAGARHAFDDMPAHIKPTRILADRFPDADRLGRVVLEQHADFGNAAPGERGPEGAGHHHVAALILGAEQTGIAFEAAIGGKARFGRAGGSRVCHQQITFETERRAQPAAQALAATAIAATAARPTG